MKILLPFITKLIEQTKVGELIGVPSYGDQPSEIAIVLNHLEDGNSTLAVLRPEGTSQPHFSVINSEADCVSYGVEWMLEILPNEWSSDSKLALKTNVAAISGDRVYFYFQSAPHTRLRAGYLDVGALQIKSSPSNAVFTKSWKLWPSDSERQRLGAVPLLQGD